MAMCKWPTMEMCNVNIYENQFVCDVLGHWFEAQGFEFGIPHTVMLSGKCEIHIIKSLKL